VNAGGGGHGGGGGVFAEMCTEAFLKMYEMLAAYDLVVPTQDMNIPTQDMNKFNTLHLCEAPGDVFGCFLHHSYSFKHELMK
jgi:hypothetical protein